LPNYTSARDTFFRGKVNPFDSLAECTVENLTLPNVTLEKANMTIFSTAGGRITCLQCNAKSKRTKQQCKAPASKGKTTCRFHGGKSTGPKTEKGRQRCAEAKTIHGRETRETRSERSLDSARLAVLEAVGHQLGFMTGARTRGPKPTRMPEVYPELQACCESALPSR